jgi:hypothetical protein
MIPYHFTWFGQPNTIWLRLKIKKVLFPLYSAGGQWKYAAVGLWRTVGSVIVISLLTKSKAHKGIGAK